jgi:hypothetical protein
MYFAAKKRVCDVQKYWRDRERVNKRKHPKVWGAGESGVARGPETEVVQGCQMVGEKQSAVVCVVCVEGGRGGVGVSVCWLWVGDWRKLTCNIEKAIDVGGCGGGVVVLVVVDG